MAPSVATDGLVWPFAHADGVRIARRFNGRGYLFLATAGITLLASLAPATASPPQSLGNDLRPVATWLAALPADVSQTGAAAEAAIVARLGGPAAGVRVLVSRRPDDGHAHGGTLLPSLLVLTDPRSVPAEAQPTVQAVLAGLQVLDHGQFRWQRPVGTDARGRRDPGGPPTPGLLPLTWALLVLGALALPLALRDAVATLWPAGLNRAGRWTAVAFAAGLALRLWAPHRLVMVHFGWLLVDQSAELRDLPRYGPAPPLLYHALFQVFGADAAVVQHAHVVLGTLGLMLLAAWAARLLPDVRTAPVVAWLGALLPLSVLDHSSESLLVPAFTAWLAAALLVDRAILTQGKDTLRWPAAGVLLALCGLARPDTMALALPGLVLWLVVRHGLGAIRRRGLPLLGLGLAVGVVWIPGIQFLLARAHEDVAMGNLPRLTPTFLLHLPQLLAQQWVVLHGAYFPLAVTALAVLGLGLSAVRRAVAGLGLLALAWAAPMLLDFNETSMLRLHAPSAQLVAAAAGLALVAAWQRWGVRAGATGALVIMAMMAGTVPAVFADQNSDSEEVWLRAVAERSHDGRPATYVTRGYDDPPDHGIHLLQPRHLLEPHDRWLAVQHFERDPAAAFARGPVYFVRGVRCYAHDRRGAGAPAADWVHPACAAFCARWRCQPVEQQAVPNRGERGFAWYPSPAQLPWLHVGWWEVLAPQTSPAPGPARGVAR